MSVILPSGAMSWSVAMNMASLDGDMRETDEQAAHDHPFTMTPQKWYERKDQSMESQ